MRKGKLTTIAATALVFVLLIGIVNLFADFTGCWVAAAL